MTDTSFLTVMILPKIVKYVKDMFDFTPISTPQNSKGSMTSSNKYDCICSACSWTGIRIKVLRPCPKCKQETVVTVGEFSIANTPQYLRLQRIREKFEATYNQLVLYPGPQNVVDCELLMQRIEQAVKEEFDEEGGLTGKINTLVATDTYAEGPDQYLNNAQLGLLLLQVSLASTAATRLGILDQAYNKISNFVFDPEKLDALLEANENNPEFGLAILELVSKQFQIHQKHVAQANRDIDWDMIKVLMNELELKSKTDKDNTATPTRQLAAMFLSMMQERVLPPDLETVKKIAAETPKDEV